MVNQNSLKNLEKGKKTQFKSGDDAAKKGSAGGKKSQKVQAEKRKAAELAKMVLDLSPKMPPAIQRQMEELGIKSKKPEAKLIAIAAQMRLAMAGNLKSLEYMLELAGDTPEATGGAYVPQDDEVALDEEHVRKTLDDMSDEQLRSYQDLCRMFRRNESEESADE